MIDKIVIAVEKSTNRKTGEVSAVYAPLKTCSDSCPFKRDGCYAKYGPCGIKVNRLDAAAERATIVEIARAEAKAIRGLTGERPLRLHVSGDCRTNETARIVSAACDEYASRHNQTVWSYTHSWKDVEKDSWGGISIWASCETAYEVAEARQRGYPAIMIYSDAFERKGFRIVPCKAQIISGMVCTECKLCFRSYSAFRHRRVIGFQPHGPKTMVNNIIFRKNQLRR